MISFLHALRICTIASVFTKVHGYVFLAANIEDFRSIASKFLPEHVAKKLMDLVIQSSVANKAIGRQQDDESAAPETSLNKIAETLKEKLLNKFSIPLNSGEQNTTIYNSKRYKTIKNNDEMETFKQILRKPESKIKTAAALNVREEYENRLKQYIEDYAYSDDKKNDYESKPMVPFEEFREKRGEDVRYIDTNNKYDYTETKLGDWNFNQKAPQKPIKIKNVKTSNTDIGSNDETASDVIKTNNEISKYLSGNAELITGKDHYKIDQNDLFENINEKQYDSRWSESKSKSKYLDDKMYSKNSQDSRNNDMRDHKPSGRQAKEQVIYNEDVLKLQEKYIHKRKPSPQLREKNDMQQKHELDYKTEYTNEPKIVKHRDINIRRPPKQLIKKNILYENNESDYKTGNEKGRHGLKRNSNESELKWQLKEENDLYNKYDLGSKAKGSIEHKVSKHKDTHGRKPSKPQKNQNERSEKDESNFTTENNKHNQLYKHDDTNIRKPRKKPIQINDLYDKYSLGSKPGDGLEHKLKGSHKEKHEKQPIKENYMYDQDFPVFNPRESTSKYIENIPKNILQKNENHEDFKTENREDPNISKHKNVKPHKTPIEQNDMYDKYVLGSKTDGSKERDQNNRVIHKKPQKQPIEINDMYEKFDLDFKENKGQDKHETADNFEFENEQSLIRNKKLYPFEEEFETGKIDEFTTANILPALEGFVDDPLPDFKEVKAGAIKARTESLIDNNEGDNFIMNGTDIPTRKIFKMSSPDYYRKLPRIVDKYDFDEPLPEGDRERDKKVYIKREPSMVNRKIKLPQFDTV